VEWAGRPLRSPDQTVSAAEFRFDERVIETVIGVGIAYVYGLLFAAIARRRTPV